MSSIYSAATAPFIRMKVHFSNFPSLSINIFGSSSFLDSRTLRTFE